MNRMCVRVHACMCALYDEKYEQRLAPVHAYINTVCTRCCCLHTLWAHDAHDALDAHDAHA